jgi:hypothetical protein
MSKRYLVGIGVQIQSFQCFLRSKAPKIRLASSNARLFDHPRCLCVLLSEFRSRTTIDIEFGKVLLCLASKQDKDGRGEPIMGSRLAQGARDDLMKIEWYERQDPVAQQWVSSPWGCLVGALPSSAFAVQMAFRRWQARR